jgi:hypothetical protein
MEWAPKGETEESSYEVVDKVTVRKKDDSEMLTILANNPIRTLDSDYFEVKFLEKENHSSSIAIGLGVKDVKIDSWPGLYSGEQAIAYHCDTGVIYNDGTSLTNNHVSFSVNDVIGCGVDYYGYCYFTVNGKRVETEKSSCKVDGRIFHPLISLGNTDTEVLANFGQQTFLYKQPNATNIFGQWMDEMRNSKKSGSQVFHNHLSDITLVSKDGEEVSCHRLVLSLRSTVFKEMIKSDEVIDGRINICQFDAPTVRQMVDFLYTDSIELDDESINFDLWAIAVKYELEELKRVFGEELIPKINLQNVVEFWSKATLYSQHEKILSECGAFIQKNWDDVKETEGFVSLMENDKKAAIMLMVDVLGNEAKVSMKQHLRGLLINSNEQEETSD